MTTPTIRAALRGVQKAPSPLIVRYEFEVLDEHDQTVASGDASTLMEAERDGRHYLEQYQMDYHAERRDRPCTLELRRVEVLNLDATAPPAPEPGEVGELAARLTLISEGMSAMDQEEDSWFVARAATVIKQQATELAALRGVPVAVSERPWEREEWCDEQGRCWLGSVGSRNNDPGWVYRKPHEILHQTISLPHNAIPLPAPQAGEGEA